MTELGPTVIIGGAQKAGTTSLYFYLAQHPDIHVSTIKEPGYFAFDAHQRWAGPAGRSFRASLVTAPADYLNLFRAAGNAIHRCEASTYYLSSPDAPARIVEFDPAIRMIFLLRDPVERIRSAFHFLRQRGFEPLNDVLAGVRAWDERRSAGWPPYFDYIGLSSYATHLRRYLSFFPAESILCINYERFRESPISVLRDVERFLGLPAHASYNTGVRHNVTGASRFRMLQRVLDAGRADLRGKLRQLAPDWVHRTVVQLRAWNTQSGPRLDPAERDTLRVLLEEEVEGVRALLGGEFTAEWQSFQP
jgi:hypothetical protein